LAVAQAVQLVLLRKAQIEFYSMSQKATSPEGRTSDQDEVTFDHFCLYYTGLCSLALVTPALISYAQSVISYDASWESIDYVFYYSFHYFVYIYEIL
jgi:hypothetical protein